MTIEPSSWPDERLAAAFTARMTAAPPTPPDLAAAALERIAGTRRARHPWGWAAAAAAIAVLVGVAGFSLLRFDDRRGSGPGVTSSVQLPDPITVDQAIAIRDATDDDRELVIAGFQSGESLPSCPFVPAVENPTAIHCPQSFDWLMAQPEILWVTTGNATSGEPPKGPALHASYALVERGFAFDAAKPVAVEVVGHFHDRRAALCPADEVAACRETFVVDRVQTVNRGPRQITTLRLADSEPPVATEDDVEALVARAAPDDLLASLQLRTGDGLADAEPALHETTTFTKARLVWIVTTTGLRNDTPVARTFLVVDGSTNLIEMTADGPISRPVPAASSEVSAVPSPPQTGDITFPETWLGLPVVSVADLDLQPGTTLTDDRTIAVRGWVHPARSHCDMSDVARPNRPDGRAMPRTAGLADGTARTPLDGCGPALDRSPAGWGRRQPDGASRRGPRGS